LAEFGGKGDRQKIRLNPHLVFRNTKKKLEQKKGDKDGKGE
jgi:hypothetical protein